jgi:hypothetical protein
MLIVENIDGAFVRISLAIKRPDIQAGDSTSYSRISAMIGRPMTPFTI